MKAVIRVFTAIVICGGLFNINALELPEPVTWQDLQVIQQDSLLGLQELGLSQFCPKSVTTQSSNTVLLARSCFRAVDLGKSPL